MIFYNASLFIAHQSAYDMVVDALPRRRYYGTGTDYIADVMYHAAMAASVSFAMRRAAEMRSRGEL